MIIEGPTQYFVVKNRIQLDWLVQKLHSNPEWSFDTETTGLDFLKDKIFILTFSWQIRSACLIDRRFFPDPEDQAYLTDKLKEVFDNPSKKIPHNGSFDIEFLMSEGIRVNNYFADTIHMHYLLDENKKHGLEVLAAEMTDLVNYDLPLAEYKKANKIDSYADIPPEILHPYALMDADVTFRCYKIMYPQIFEQGLDFVLFHVIMPIQKILIMTSYRGVSIDVEHLKRTQAKYAREMEESYAAAMSVPAVKEFIKEKQDLMLANLYKKWEASKTLSKRFPIFDDYAKSLDPKKTTFEFNVKSPYQLKELLIDKMKLPVVQRTKKGAASLNSDALEIYAKKNPFCAEFSKHRSLGHLKSTFLDGTLESLDDNNRVHTDYLLFSTVTGRPSSRNPNLNNIPRSGTADGIKDIFCADRYPDGSHDWMISVDQGQAEFRMWMNYCKDPQAYRDLEMGLDIHKIVAAAAKGIKVPIRGDITYEAYKEYIKDVIKAERQQAKNVVFGAMYGRGVRSISEELGISIRAAQAILDFFFGRYPFAKRWLEDTVKKARKNGMVTSIFGRHRRLLNINSPESGYRSEAERQAVNSPIQSAASDLTFMACIRMFKKLWPMKVKTRMILTVYDSLVFNVPDDEIKLVYKIIADEMTASPRPDVDVKLSSDMEIGINYGSLKVIDSNLPPDEFYNKLHEMFPD